MTPVDARGNAAPSTPAPTPIARGTSCPGHVLVPWAHSPIWFRQDAIFVRLSKALPIKGRRAPSSSKAVARPAAPDREPTTPRPHEVGSVRRSARQAAAARWSRAGGAAGPSRPASARRSRLDLSPAPVCARTEAVWRCDRRGGGARRRSPRGAADACGAAGWRAGSCSNRVCARCASAPSASRYLLRYLLPVPRLRPSRSRRSSGVS